MSEILIGVMSFIAGAAVVHYMWTRAVRKITKDIKKQTFVEYFLVQHDD